MSDCGHNVRHPPAAGGSHGYRGVTAGPVGRATALDGPARRCRRGAACGGSDLALRLCDCLNPQPLRARPRTDRADVAAALAAYGNALERRIDRATIGDRVFVNNASIGVYATVVQSDAYRNAKLATTAQATGRISRFSGSANGPRPSSSWTPDNHWSTSESTVRRCNYHHRCASVHCPAHSGSALHSMRPARRPPPYARPGRGGPPQHSSVSWAAVRDSDLPPAARGQRFAPCAGGRAPADRSGARARIAVLMRGKGHGDRTCPADRARIQESGLPR